MFFLILLLHFDIFDSGLTMQINAGMWRFWRRRAWHHSLSDKFKRRGLAAGQVSSQKFWFVRAVLYQTIQ